MGEERRGFRASSPVEGVKGDAGIPGVTVEHRRPIPFRNCERVPEQDAASQEIRSSKNHSYFHKNTSPWVLPPLSVVEQELKSNLLGGHDKPGSIDINFLPNNLSEILPQSLPDAKYHKKSSFFTVDTGVNFQT